MSAAQLARGIALAAGAAACFDGAVALQAVEARAVAQRAVGAGLLRALIARPRWVAATALAIAGWPLQVAALALAPLTVVQPALALGLVVLLALGRRLLGEPVRPRDYVAVAAIAGGLAILAVFAPESRGVEASATTLAAIFGALGLVALAPWLAPRVPGAALVIAAGCAYAASGLTTKLLADSLDEGALLVVVAWALASAAAAGTGLADEMGALQRVGAARVAAGAFALQTAIPVAAAPALGEHWDHPAGVAAGLALVVAGSLVLGVARAVTGLVSAAHE